MTNDPDLQLIEKARLIDEARRGPFWPVLVEVIEAESAKHLGMTERAGIHCAWYAGAAQGVKDLTKAFDAIVVQANDVVLQRHEAAKAAHEEAAQRGAARQEPLTI